MNVILREKKQKSNNISLYLEINQNNSRKREYISVIKKDDKKHIQKQKREFAELVRSQRAIEVLASGTIYVPEHKRKTDFIEFYRNYLSNYGKADVKMIRYSLEKFISFLLFSKIINKSNDILLPVHINKNLCEDFRDYLKNDAGLNGETPQNYFSRFKKVMKQATKDGLFKSNPVEDIIFEKGSQDKRNRLVKEVLSISEIKLLRETYCGNDEVKRAFLFSCLSGLGLAEIKKLQWKNIKPVENTYRLLVDREKTGRQVNIKLSNSAVEVLGKFGKSTDKIFKIDVSDNAVNKAIEYWIKRAGIDKNITYYCARHSYAVNLLKLSNNIKVVADAMGQTSTQHTAKYLNFIDGLKDDATGGLEI